ncbi:hypothetical protein RF11_14738 [Thelohanellus kitauei]|uniref:Uncharacterized protein n=1 Tax=Thelohanellus kitauei TaxID=669202 RepID=A0A0C2MXF6_THEKT|nr:hypothetical protein RF11_14738 [Thelohanellus kitauei]
MLSPRRENLIKTCPKAKVRYFTLLIALDHSKNRKPERGITRTVPEKLGLSKLSEESKRADIHQLAASATNQGCLKLTVNKTSFNCGNICKYRQRTALDKNMSELEIFSLTIDGIEENSGLHFVTHRVDKETQRCHSRHLGNLRTHVKLPMRKAADDEKFVICTDMITITDKNCKSKQSSVDQESPL